MVFGLLGHFGVPAMPQAVLIPLTEPPRLITLSSTGFAHEMAKALGSNVLMPIAVSGAVMWVGYRPQDAPVNPWASEWSGTDVYGPALVAGHEMGVVLLDVPTHVLIAFGITE